MDYFTLECHNSFQNKNNRKATHSFNYRFLSCNKTFKSSIISV